jgi:hypothetical protein
MGSLWFDERTIRYPNNFDTLEKFIFKNGNMNYKHETYTVYVVLVSSFF